MVLKTKQYKRSSISRTFIITDSNRYVHLIITRIIILILILILIIIIIIIIITIIINYYYYHYYCYNLSIVESDTIKRMHDLIPNSPKDDNRNVMKYSKKSLYAGHRTQQHNTFIPKMAW